MVKNPLILFVAGYKKFISPFLPPSCRFYPGCSDYAREAIENHGTIKGCCYALGRLLRCHPFNPGGYDPVPEEKIKDRFCRGKNC